MYSEHSCSRLRRSRGWLPILTLFAALGAQAQSQGQTSAPETLFPNSTVQPATYSASSSPAASDSGIVPVGCSSCGGDFLNGPPPPPGIGEGIPCAKGCGCTQCYPGEVPCDCCCDPKTFFGRFWNGLYHCICCPDPCYLSTWRPLANNAFFVDQVKPVTQINVDGLWAQDYTFPDKAEYFWAKENGKGPKFPGTSAAAGAAATAAGAAGSVGVPGGTSSPPKPGEPSLNYNMGLLYFEGAVQRFSMFIGLPYLNVQPTVYGQASNFGDMFVGTKSLLLDCELIQFTFAFRVFIPTGNFTQGIGTGHVAFQPQLITAIKLAPTTYFQGQVYYWWPDGGTDGYQGAVWNWQLAVNQLLYHCGCEKSIDIIGSVELGGYDIANGAYTAPVTGASLSARDIGDIVNIGPGIRAVICRKIDIGFGSQFAISKNKMAGDYETVQFRWRF